LIALRYFECCPNCGYREDKNWRPRFINIEEDVIEAEAVPELVAKMTHNIPYVEGEWAYYLPRTRRYVYRVQRAIFDAWGGKWMSRRAFKLGLKSGRRSMQIKFNRRLANRQKQTHLTELEGEVKA